MKLFDTVLKTFAFFGLQWDENLKKFLITKKIYMPYILCATCFTTSGMFLIYEANTFSEYILAAFLFSSVIECITVCAIVEINVTKFDDFVEYIQNMINGREFKISFAKLFLVKMFFFAKIQILSFNQYYPNLVVNIHLIELNFSHEFSAIVMHFVILFVISFWAFDTLTFSSVQ